MVRFGPAGNSESFYAQGYKSSEQAMKWLHEQGLSAYEYQCGQGVRVGKATAEAIGAEAAKYDIALSIHAPYFVSLASPESEKRENSINYIMQSLKAARYMGAKRVVFHPGGIGKFSREAATAMALEMLPRIIARADEEGYGDIVLCPEVMGKINQLGNIEEVLQMCELDERMIPTFDFGHINARTLGSLKSAEDFESIINMIEDKLGNERMRNLHCHFSRIQFSKGGEVRHWNYEDNEHGPDFEPFAEIIVQKNMTPIIICESAGKQAEDSGEYKRIYEHIKQSR